MIAIKANTTKDIINLTPRSNVITGSKKANNTKLEKNIIKIDKHIHVAKKEIAFI